MSSSHRWHHKSNVNKSGCIILLEEEQILFENINISSVPPLHNHCFSAFWYFSPISISSGAPLHSESLFHAQTQATTVRHEPSQSERGSSKQFFGKTTVSKIWSAFHLFYFNYLQATIAIMLMYGSLLPDNSVVPISKFYWLSTTKVFFFFFFLINVNWSSVYNLWHCPKCFIYLRIQVLGQRCKKR